MTRTHTSDHIGGSTLEYGHWPWVEPHQSDTVRLEFARIRVIGEVYHSNVCQTETKCITLMWLNRNKFFHLMWPPISY